jgi:chromosome segregation ATPase
MNSVFALAGPPPDPDLKALIAKLRKPSALVAALDRWNERHREYALVQAQLRAEIQALQAQGGETRAGNAALIARIHELDARARRCGEQIRDAGEMIESAKGPYSEAVSRALAPHRRRAAGEALEAAAQLQAAVGRLADLENELALAGARPVLRPLPYHRDAMAPLVTRLRQLAQ